MEENRLERVSKSGCWKLKDNEPVFEEETIRRVLNPYTREWEEVKPHPIVYKTPIEMGLLKEVETYLLICREQPSLSYEQPIRRIWFKIPVKFTVRTDAQDVWLSFPETKRVGLTHLKIGFSYEMALKSNEFCIVEMAKAVRVKSEDEFKQLLTQTGYVFSKVEGSGKDVLYGQRVT